MKRHSQFWYRLTRIVLLLLLATMIFSMAVGVLGTVRSVGTSFPWYSAIVINGLYFLLPVSAALLLHLFFRYRVKREQASPAPDRKDKP